MNLLKLYHKSESKNNNKSTTLYIAVHSVPLSVCVHLLVCLYPPFFLPDHRTATKFGAHVRIDMGLILS